MARAQEQSAPMPTHPHGMGASSLPKEEEEEGKGPLQEPGTNVSTPHACRRCTQTVQTNTIYPNPARKIKNKPVIEAIWRRFNWGQTTGAGCCCHLQRFLQAVTAAPGGPGPRSLLSEGRCCWGRTRGCILGATSAHRHSAHSLLSRHDTLLHQRQNRAAGQNNSQQ